MKQAKKSLSEVGVGHLSLANLAKQSSIGGPRRVSGFVLRSHVRAVGRLLFVPSSGQGLRLFLREAAETALGPDHRLQSSEGLLMSPSSASLHPGKSRIYDQQHTRLRNTVEAHPYRGLTFPTAACTLRRTASRELRSSSPVHLTSSRPPCVCTIVTWVLKDPFRCHCQLNDA